jgi:hypothetical protein
VSLGNKKPPSFRRAASFEPSVGVLFRAIMLVAAT